MSVVKVSVRWEGVYEFARGCQSAACRPPTSGGTGGSGSKGGAAAKSAPAGGGASIKGGRPVIDGKPVAGKISGGSGRMYTAKMHEAHGGKMVFGSTRKELLQNVEKAVADQGAAGRLGRDRAAAGKYGMGLDARVQESMVKAGRTSASKVAIGRDGAVKVNGKPLTDVKVTKVHDGYMISNLGMENQKGYNSRRFKTLAAAKTAVAGKVNKAVAS